MDETKPTSPPDAVTFLLSFVGTTLVLLVLIGGAAMLWASKKAAAATRGWNLVPVVKAARDLEAGTALARSDVEEGLLPQQLATASVVTPPDVPSLVGKTLTTPLKRGDPVWRAHVASRPRLLGCEARVLQAWGRTPEAEPGELPKFIEEVHAEVRARQSGWR